MLESTESLLPAAPSHRKLKAFCAGFEPESVDEMRRLLTTLGIDVIESEVINLRGINPATYIGKGKCDEIRDKAKAAEADAVIVDVELSPNQLRNLEKAFDNRPVLDRPGVIIEIFSRHARTKESKTQVEIARLNYLLPRLAHFWTHFERQRGGIGLKGMGEKQIEVDRRLVKKRIEILTDRLKAIGRERNVQRAGRKDVLKVALVGYTNAGKSTLLNALTQSDVLAEDKLFATLDASVRSLDPHSHPPVVAIDTVGFISNLPPSLVASFRSTLEELHEADLLLHVVDASSAHARDQLLVTEGILKDLGVGDKPRITVLNKVDLLGEGPARNRARLIYPGAVSLSALDKTDVEKLRDRVLAHFRQSLDVWELVVPYGESRLEAMIHAHGSIENKRHVEKGTFFRVRMEKGMFRKLGLEKYCL